MKKYSADLMIGFYVEAENEEDAIKKIREEYEKDPLFLLDEALSDIELIEEDEAPTSTVLIGSAIDMRKVFDNLSKHYKGWESDKEVE
jgi:hypothetical protein